MSSTFITITGTSLLFFYCLIKILTYYGVDMSSYGVYVTFYLFIGLSMLILPNSYPKI
jgi:hypothetical protein